MNKPISSLFVFSVVYCVVLRQKLKKTRRQQNKNRNTGFPAHEPPRKINISKGLAGRFLFFLYCFFMFSFEFCFFCLICLFYVFICVFFDCKCKRLKRLGENIKQTERNRTTTKQLKEQHTTLIQDIQPSTRPRINISQVPAGRFLLSFLK